MNRIFNLTFWQQFWANTLDRISSGGLKIFVILVIYVVVRRAVLRGIDLGVERLLNRQTAGVGEDRTNRLRTLQGLARSFAGYVLLFIVTIMLLDTLGANITGIITTAGVGGLAIGFGAQKLVKDVIAGFFLIVEDQFVVGDYVTVGPATGVVEDLGIRITRVRDDQGRLWTLSNGDINVVTNYSRAPVFSFFEISVASGEDIHKAKTVVDAATLRLYNDKPGGLFAPPVMSGVCSFDSIKTTMRVSISADPSTLNAEQMRVREITRRALLDADINLG